MLAPRAVDLLDQRRERGALTAADRSRDEDEAVLVLGQHLELRGQPVAQRKHVASLPSNVRLLLCMWLTDMGTAAKLINRTEAQVSR